MAQGKLDAGQGKGFLQGNISLVQNGSQGDDQKGTVGNDVPSFAIHGKKEENEKYQGVAGGWTGG